METKIQIEKLYRQFRNTGGCLVGHDAESALRSARTLAEWREAERAGLVRLRAEPEEENYFDVYGEPEGYEGMNGRRVSAEQERKELVAQLDNLGCWNVFSQVFEEGEWITVDGIGMCAGYNDPLSPFENCYVPDLMRAALDRIPVCGEH